MVASLAREPPWEATAVPGSRARGSASALATVIDAESQILRQVDRSDVQYSGERAGAARDGTFGRRQFSRQSRVRAAARQ